MRYKYFRFENFKGIRAARLDLDAGGADARVFTLVGLNESGKTTVLEAIDHFVPKTDEGGREVSPKELAGWVEPDPHDLIPIAERRNFNGKIAIVAGLVPDAADVSAVRKRLGERSGFRLSSLTSTIEITIQYEFAKSRLVGRQTLWTSHIGDGFLRTGRVMRAVSPQEDRNLWQEAVNAIRDRIPTIWYFPNFLFEFPRRINLVQTEDESDANRFYRALFQDVLIALDDDLTVEEHVVRRARSGDATDARHLRQLLVDVSRDITRTVARAWNDLFADKELADKRVQLELVQTSGDSGVYIEFWLEDTDGLFGIHERSLGFRWFFVYLLLTTYRGRRGGDEEILFLFDEPASNLHPRAQAALLESINKLSSRSLVIYTTHSHHLINPGWLSSTFVVINKGLDPTQISAELASRRTDVNVERFHHFAAQHPNRTHFFQPVLDVLDYAPSQLELVPSVAMVEGKTDYFALRYFQEVVLQADERVALLPGTGAGSLDAVIQLYVAWARRFVVLLDADRSGEREAARYASKFGSLVKERLFTLSDAVGRKTEALESLFTEEERLAFTRLVDPDATKEAKKGFALGIQEAFATRTRVDVSAGTQETFATLLGFLHRELSEEAD